MKDQVSFYIREVKNVASKGFFYLFAAQGFIFIAGFISQFFVAAILEPADIGRIKIMQSYIELSTLICGLGFNTSLLKLASEDKSDAEKKKLYQCAFVITTICFGFIYIIFYFLSSLGIVSADPAISQIFPVYALFLLPLSLQNIQLAYYQAQKKIKTMARLQLIIKAISILFIISVTYFFKLRGYIITVVSTALLGVIIFELGLKNIRLTKSYFMPDSKLVKKMWHLARFALFTNMLGVLTSNIDIYLINYLITDRKEVGYYMFAVTILSVYQLVPTTIQQVAFPFFSEQSSNHKRWYNSYLKYNKLNHLLVLLVVSGGILFLPPLIRIAFSGKYDASVHYLMFLSIAWMIKSANIMKGTAIMGYGRFDVNFRSSAITLVLTIPLIFILIKYFKFNGAIVAMIASAVISYITVSIIFHRFNKQLLNR